MKCQFNIDLDSNESDDDPYVDADEALMEIEQVNKLNKVDDFEVSQKRKRDLGEVLFVHTKEFAWITTTCPRPL